jgi:type IX secretion system PorP/SprF family membrane protein
MRFIRIFLPLVMIAVWGQVNAQQIATYSQYMFNQLAINPGYAGSHGALSATFLSRFQNVGLPGAPNTQTLAVHSPTNNRNVALGLLAIHDQIGVIDQSGIHGSYAYRVPLTLLKSKGVISFGVQAGVSTYRADYTQLDKFDQADPAFDEDIRQTRPNFGAGVFFSSPVWYVGLSMPHMMNNVFDRNSSLETIRQNVPMMLAAGYVFPIHRQMKLKPNMLFKLVDGQPVELDLNAMILFDEVVWVGVSYKVSSAVNLITQIQATDQLSIGYSYNITTGQLRAVDMGSHEMMVNYRFRYYKKAIVTPRYF